MTTIGHLFLGATAASGVAIMGSLLVAFSLLSELNPSRDDVLLELNQLKSITIGAFFKSYNLTYDRTILYDEILLGEWDLDKTIYFMERTNLPISVLVVILYIAMVNFGQMFMANRKPLNLRAALAIWNFTLSIYSFVTVYKILPFFIQSVRRDGIVGSLCHNNGQYSDPVSGYWTWLFAMSKGPELIDTMFLVLRKRPVIFMHWYHHSVTFLVAQIFFSHSIACAKWGVVFNGTVHTVMYFYYGLKVLNVRTPKHFARFLTLLQIFQFAYGIGMAIAVIYFYMKNEMTPSTCPEGRMDLIPPGLFVCVSYLYLFCDYFLRAHIRGQSPTKCGAEIVKTGGYMKNEMGKKEQ